jgi:hypothetical protein
MNKQEYNKFILIINLINGPIQKIELTELRKQHQEDINRLETHVTENSKDIVGMFLFNLPGQVKPKTIKLVLAHLMR